MSIRERKVSSSVLIHHANLPCGKKYSGETRTVRMLVRMHQKKCNLCLYSKERHVGVKYTEHGTSTYEKMHFFLSESRNG